jgi:hypothetical protein
MFVKTCNSAIDSILNQFITVSDDVNIFSQVDMHIINSSLNVDYKITGNFFRKSRAYVFSVKLEDRALAAKIHNHSNELNLGDIYSDSHLYRIELQLHGLKLTASNAMYQETSFLSNNFEFISFCIEIIYVDTSREGNFAELVILDQLKFLGNHATKSTEESPYGIYESTSQDVSETISERYKLIIKQYDGQTRIQLSRNDLAQITEIDIESVLHSLSIVRTELLYPSIAVKLIQNANNMIFNLDANYLVDYKTPALPPIYAMNDAFWEYEPLLISLLDKYGMDNRDYYLSIIKVLSDSKSLIQTQLLSLCTSIECLSKPIPVTVGDTESQETERLVQIAKDAINKEINPSQFEEMNRRLIGCIASVGDTQSAQNKLKRASKDGYVSEVSVSAWRTIRNTLAHGSEVFNQKKYDKYHDSIKQLYVLLYQLLFLIIDYSGEYTDYNSIKNTYYEKKSFTKVFK